MKKIIDTKNPLNCVACTSCVNTCPSNAIELRPDSEGFLYPIINKEKCLSCGLCAKSCPMDKVNNNFTPLAYAAKSNDKEILKQSSSGGIFYYLAEEVIKNNGTVFGAALTDENFVKHIGVDNIENIIKLIGSKYVQSDLNETFSIIKEKLNNNQKVLFVGTPCQVAGLNFFLKNKTKNLITVDLICHGVPSPKVFKKYIEHIEKCFKKKINHISFRNKKINWSRFSFVAEFTDKTEFSEEFTHNTYMKGFINNLFLRPSCYHCHFKNGNYFSDITLGDFWGIKKINPELHSDLGVSLCCINSKRGADIFDAIKPNLTATNIPFEEAVKYNSAYTTCVKTNNMREWFFKHLEKTPIEKNINQSLSPKLFARLLLKIQKRKYISDKWN